MLLVVIPNLSSKCVPTTSNSALLFFCYSGAFWLQPHVDPAIMSAGSKVPLGGSALPGGVHSPFSAPSHDSMNVARRFLFSISVVAK